MRLIPLLFVSLLCTTAHSAVTAIAGSDSNALPASPPLLAPFAVDFDQRRNAYIAEMTGHRIRLLSPEGKLVILAGSGVKGDRGDDGPAVAAAVNGPHHLLVGPGDDLFIADTWNNRVRVIDSKTGIIRTLAGTGQKGFLGDGGDAKFAQFGGVYCIAFDHEKRNLFICDLDNRRIRKVDLATNLVSTVAGNGQRGIPTDGKKAIDSPLVDPRAIAVDAKGNLYILERSGHALRVVRPDGGIQTLAGTGKPGPLTPEPDPLKATFNGPKHLSIDSRGDVLIADTENHAIRKYSVLDRKLTTVAGTGKKGNAVHSDPLQCQLSQPHGVVERTPGRLYISDSSNNRVLLIAPE